MFSLKLERPQNHAKSEMVPEFSYKFDQEKLTHILKQDLSKNRGLLKEACSISKKSSQTLSGMQEQRIKQQLLEQKMKEANVKGKYSLIKYAVLRNKVLLPTAEEDDYNDAISEDEQEWLTPSRKTSRSLPLGFSAEPQTP